jgi:hypothetical protein
VTPIEDARNLGPKTGVRLRAIGVETLEDLRSMGWREVCERLAAFDPAAIHLTFFQAVAGAEFDVDWRELDPQIDAEVRRLRDSLRT